MRATINTRERNELPINMYAMGFAVSGTGKGHSMNIMEEQLIGDFRSRFLNETFLISAEKNLAKIANKRAAKKNTDNEEELERVKKEFEDLGELLFSFDSATPAAVKQMRHKLLMADAGSVNLEIDEIGSNLLGNMDVITTFLELYDVGKIKQKLIKNTKENTRNEPLEGKTPTNMLLFGTPNKTFDGGKTEAELISMLDTGYGRRCFFSYDKHNAKALDLTPEEIYDMMTDEESNDYLDEISHKLAQLADINNFGVNLAVPKEIAIEYITYQQHCERIAAELPEHEEIRKAELSHRYFKSLKLAGTYAFIEGSHEITMDHLYQGIKMAEESGKAFTQLLTRDKPHVRLAKYIVQSSEELTHADLVEALPFYRGTEAAKRDLMTLAIGYGYKRNMVIQKSFNNGIEFFKGSALQETDINRLIVSHSNHYSEGYEPEYAPFDKLEKLVTMNNRHWVNHHLTDKYRQESNAILGFNTVVIDVDGTCSLDTARLVLKDYKYLLHTTKSHGLQGKGDRYRIIFPISHVLKLDSSEFKEFMENIYEWLPFETDDQTNQRSRKWEGFSNANSICEYNDGKILDVLDFIPKTSKNEERKAKLADLGNLNNLERWFVNNTGDGNRSNQMIKYALMLVDAGKQFDEIENHVLGLNHKIPDKLSEDEIQQTIMRTVAKRLSSR